MFTALLFVLSYIVVFAAGILIGSCNKTKVDAAEADFKKFETVVKTKVDEVKK